MKRNVHFQKREIDPQDRPYEREIVLWRAVIDQALLDFLNDDPFADDRQSRIAAQVWLRGNSPDFWTVCELARLDPNIVIEEINILVNGRDKLFKDL